MTREECDFLHTSVLVSPQAFEELIGHPEAVRIEDAPAELRAGRLGRWRFVEIPYIPVGQTKPATLPPHPKS